MACCDCLKNGKTSISVYNLDVEGAATSASGGFPASAIQLSYAGTMSGIWDTPQAININLSLLGNMVYMTVTGSLVANATMASYITFDQPIPAPFTPIEQFYCPLVIDDNTVLAMGYIETEANGSVYVSTLTNGGSFMGTGFSGIGSSFTVMWPNSLQLP